jgi:hypothetical protein
VHILAVSHRDGSHGTLKDLYCIRGVPYDCSQYCSVIFFLFEDMKSAL